MQKKLNFKQIILSGLLAAISAAVINVILFFVFHSAGILTDDIFIQSNQPLTFIQVIISSVVPTLIASMVFFLFDKYTSNGFKFFSIMAIILLILSMASPFMAIPDVNTGYALVLCFMHVVVVSLLLYFIKRGINSNNQKA